jgi:hypothetical protein
MRVHTCTYMYIHAGQNQIGEPLPAIIRFRLLRDNGNLYDWPAEFGLRAAHSTVPVSFVCLPGLSAGDYFLSTPSHRSLLWSLSPHSCAFPLCNPAGSRHSLHFLFVSPWPCCDHHCRGSARPQEAQSRVSPRRPPTAPKGPRNPRSPVTHRRRRSPRSPRLRATLAALGRPNARHHPRRHSPPQLWWSSRQSPNPVAHPARPAAEEPHHLLTPHLSRPMAEGILSWINKNMTGRRAGTAPYPD